MDRTGHDADRNVFVCLDWAKGFGNTAKLNGWGGSFLPPRCIIMCH
jgi:hypothetical protein